MRLLYVRRVLTLLLPLLMCLFFDVHAMPFGGGPAGFNPMQMGQEMREPSPEELRAFEEELNREIERTIQQMSPEEKRLFDQTVERLDKMPKDKLERFLTGQMSPEEQEAFFREALPEEALQQIPQEIPTPQPTPTVEKPAQPAEPQPTPQAVSSGTLSEQKLLIMLLEAIIQRINSFFNKVNELYGDSGASHEFSGWKRRRKIRHVENYATWSDFKKDAEVLLQRLNSLQEKDPKDNTFKYLGALLTNPGIVNNLQALLSSLDKYEPSIAVSAFGVAKINKQSKNAIRMIISTLGEALKVLDIPQAIAQAIATYDPRAQHLSAAQLGIDQKALTSRRDVRPQSVAVGGRETDAFEGYDPYSYGSSYGSSYEPPYYSSSPSSYGSSRARGEETAPSRPAPSRSSGGSGGGKATAKASQAGDKGATRAQGTTPSESGVKAETKSAKDSSKDKKSKKDSKPSVKNAEERLLTTIDLNLAEALKALSAQPEFKNLITHLIDKGAVNKDVVAAIAFATKKLARAVSAAEKLQKAVKKKSPQGKNSAYGKKLTALLEHYDQELFGQLQKDIALTATEAVAREVNKNAEKVKAYLAKPTPAEESKPAAAKGADGDNSKDEDAKHPAADKEIKLPVKETQAAAPQEKTVASLPAQPVGEEPKKSKKKAAKPVPSLLTIEQLWQKLKDIAKSL